jgi:hypothetical protein
VPPEPETPHAVIEPSALRAAKPSDNGYTKIYSTEGAFAALKADGSIIAWGVSFGSSGAPSDNGYTKIYSTTWAFEGAPVPPKLEEPHAVIDPSALRAAKAYSVE